MKTLKLIIEKSSENIEFLDRKQSLLIKGGDPVKLVDKFPEQAKGCPPPTIMGFSNNGNGNGNP